MRTKIEIRFCGPVHIDPLQIFGLPNKRNNTAKWFENQTFYFIHKVRVGIVRACRLMGITEGSEVLVPSYNCGTEIDPLIKSGAQIVAYRIDDTCRIDFDDLQKKISSRTKAIYITHYFGFSDEVGKLRSLCDTKGLFLIEDCALSLFSNHVDRKLGTFGDISLFSLPKTLPVPDGGIMVINNDQLKGFKWKMRPSERKYILRLLLILIKNRLIADFVKIPIIMQAVAYFYSRHQNKRNCSKNWSSVKYPAMAGHMFYNREYMDDRDISAVTRRILWTIDSSEVIKVRRENFLRIQKQLQEIPGIRLLFTGLPDNVCPLCFPIIVNHRHEVYLHLSARFIEAFEWWSGYHPAIRWDDFPEACYLKNHLLLLPIHQKIGEREIAYIVAELKSALQAVGEL